MTHTIKMLISIFIGASLAIILFKYMDKNVIYHGPDSNEFKNKIFKHDDKCYIFKPTMYLCPQ